MHSYCSTCAFMYNFTPTDVGIFLVKMCKISYFLYFARADVIAINLEKNISISQLLGNPYYQN